MFENYYQVREWLEKYIPLVYGREELGLVRIEYLLKLLGTPQDKFKSIHVAGTAGKGSTCFYIAKLLQFSKSEILNPKSETNSKFQYPNSKKVSNLEFRASNFPTKVGLHVSPHLIDIRERMQIFQGPGTRDQGPGTSLMSMKRFLRLFNEIKPVVDSMKLRKVGEPSYFEILVAASFKYFAEEKVDFAVVEVGLGGRLDATNVLKPLVTVITNVGLDHTEILGKTVEEIAKEKAGIIKKGVPVVTAASSKALRVIEKVAKQNNSKLVKVNTRKLPYELSLQSFSDAPFLAIDVLKLLKIPFRKSVFEKVFNETFAGRFETLQLADDRAVILDGAHNPDKIKALLGFVGKYPISNIKYQIVLVIAFKKGKAWKKMVDMLIRNLSVTRVIATSFYATTDTGKFSAVSPREISDYLNSRYKQSLRSSQAAGLKIPDTKCYENSQKAVFEALQSSIDNGRPTIVLVTGSLYLVGEARTVWHLPAF